VNVSAPEPPTKVNGTVPLVRTSEKESAEVPPVIVETPAAWALDPTEMLSEPLVPVIVVTLDTLAKSESATVAAAVKLIVFVPFPPASVTLEVRLPFAKLNTSFPSPPTIESAPPPEVMMSAPEPPTMVFAELLPMMVSAWGPPMKYQLPESVPVRADGKFRKLLPLSVAEGEAA
jgi:hypothetical protein